MNADDSYIKTYINKFEHVFLDHVRKQVDTETKLAIYEAALQDLQRKLEASEKAALDNKAAFEQAISGLQAVTAEKNELKAKQEKREMEFELICSDLEKTRVEKSGIENQLMLTKQQIDELQQLLTSAQFDNATIKNNYSIVLQNLENASAELESVKSSKKNKKTVIKDSEWIDGDEISG